MLDGETKQIDKNLNSWFISDASSSEITIKLAIEDLMSVS